MWIMGLMFYEGITFVYEDVAESGPVKLVYFLYPWPQSCVLYEGIPS